MIELPRQYQIQVDWYKGFEIEVVKSVAARENYSDGTRVPNISFMFSIAWTEEMIEDLIDTMAGNYHFEKAKLEISELISFIEKLYLVDPFHYIHFRKPEDAKIGTQVLIDHTLLDIKKQYWDIDKKIKDLQSRAKSTKKRIVYQSRRTWTLELIARCERCGASHNHWVEHLDDYNAYLKARFNFVLLPKDAQRIINI